MLVAAFRATLEEVIEADLVIHVRDMSHRDAQAQARDVEKVMRELDVDPDNHQRVIEVWNKIDVVSPQRHAEIANLAERRDPESRPVLASALTGEGLDKLGAVIENRLAMHRVGIDIVLDPADGAALSWLHRNTQVISKKMRADGRIAVQVRAEPAKAAVVQRRFGGAAAPHRGRVDLRAHTGTTLPQE